MTWSEKSAVTFSRKKNLKWYFEIAIKVNWFCFLGKKR